MAGNKHLPFTVLLTISTLLVVIQSCYCIKPCTHPSHYQKSSKTSAKELAPELTGSGSVYSETRMLDYPKSVHYRTRKHAPSNYHYHHHQMSPPPLEYLGRPLYAAKLNRYRKPSSSSSYSKKNYLKKQILKIPVKTRHHIHFRDYPITSAKSGKSYYYGKKKPSSHAIYAHLLAPGPYSENYPQVIEVSAQSVPLSLIFRSASSQMNIQQIHHQAPYDQHKHQKHSYSVDEPHIVKHTVEKPIYQEIKEVIVPYRKITQQINPVQEEVHTNVATNSGTSSGTTESSSVPLAEPVPTAEPQPQVSQLYSIDPALYYPQQQSLPLPPPPQPSPAQHESGNLITNLASAAITGAAIEGYSGWKPVAQPVMYQTNPDYSGTLSSSQSLHNIPTYTEGHSQPTVTNVEYGANQLAPSVATYDTQPQLVQSTQLSLTNDAQAYPGQPLAQTYHYQTVTHPQPQDVVLTHSSAQSYQPLPEPVAGAPLAYQQSQTELTYLKDPTLNSGYGTRVSSPSHISDANLAASASTTNSEQSQKSPQSQSQSSESSQASQSSQTQADNQSQAGYQSDHTPFTVPLPPTDQTNQSLLDTYLSYASMATNHHDFGRLNAVSQQQVQDQYQAQASQQSIIRIPVYQKV